MQKTEQHFHICLRSYPAQNRDFLHIIKRTRRSNQVYGNQFFYDRIPPYPTTAAVCILSGDLLELILAWNL